MCKTQTTIGHLIFDKAGTVTVDLEKLLKSDKVHKQIAAIEQIRKIIQAKGSNNVS